MVLRYLMPACIGIYTSTLMDGIRTSNRLALTGGIIGVAGAYISSVIGVRNLKHERDNLKKESESLYHNYVEPAEIDPL